MWNWCVRFYITKLTQKPDHMLYPCSADKPNLGKASCTHLYAFYLYILSILNLQKICAHNHYQLMEQKKGWTSNTDIAKFQIDDFAFLKHCTLIAIQRLRFFNLLTPICHGLICLALTSLLKHCMGHIQMHDFISKRR